MVGQFSPLARKSIEPMALQVEGGKVRAMQRLVSEALWDEDAMLETYHGLVQDEMGEPDGVLIVDETGFVKKGQDSVGVARQYCGALGKVENCQVGVFAAYASRQGYALIDKRLFLPEPWFADAYQARRTKCKMPAALAWQSKPQLAAAMVQEIYRAGVLPFKYVVADCLYGNSPDFWAACEACVGTVAFVATPGATHKARGGDGHPTAPRRRGGPRDPSDVLVSPHCIGRDQRPDNLRIRPQTDYAVQGRAPHDSYVVAHQAHAWRPSALLVLPEQRSCECSLASLCVAQWGPVGH
jgi:SRSO17 transposase